MDDVAEALSRLAGTARRPIGDRERGERKSLCGHEVVAGPGRNFGRPCPPSPTLDPSRMRRVDRPCSWLTTTGLEGVGLDTTYLAP